VVLPGKGISVCLYIFTQYRTATVIFCQTLCCAQQSTKSTDHNCGWRSNGK